MELVIRLASPLQSWVGYRVGHDNARTEPVPTRSGIAGLLGACLGERDYLTLMEQVQVRIRVDRTNPAADDLQVAARPRPGGQTELWHREASLHLATSAIMAQQKPKAYRSGDINIVAGSLKVAYSPNRSFLPHCEFICALRMEDELGDRLLEGFRRPVFLPYLGRRANPASFPFFLGSWGAIGDVLSVLPYVPRHDEWGHVRRLRVHHITGGYTDHSTIIEHVDPPRAADRDAQLAWVKEHLTR